MGKAKALVDKHEKQVDQGLDQAGDQADQRTGGKYDKQIDKGVDAAQRRTGEGDTSPR
ncbi:antitoxin [Micromonospora rubida]|uniref:antitoxin n=1 Tax=Micromonospora rubida TaxID=2697657 RepID=UPI00191BE4D6